MMKNELEFSQLLLRHDRSLLRYILTFVPRRDDAEEILQRTATSLWEKWSEYDSSREFFPWAVRFTYFEILNYRKELARERLIFDVDVLESLKSSQQPLETRLDQQREALQECLKQLDAVGVSLLRRRYCDAESITSLASESGKTVKSLYRKLDRIRELISRCVHQRLAREWGN
ncbi:MAG TPA: sigma-70 family RNA polymerase sigma factor [Planctomicrobium sp.]|nr:sigma-70 family RNA polymerase sigma factor [Planctomicrobium sp.]